MRFANSLIMQVSLTTCRLRDWKIIACLGGEPVAFILSPASLLQARLLSFNTNTKTCDEDTDQEGTIFMAHLLTDDALL